MGQPRLRLLRPPLQPLLLEELALVAPQLPLEVVLPLPPPPQLPLEVVLPLLQPPPPPQLILPLLQPPPPPQLLTRGDVAKLLYTIKCTNIKFIILSPNNNDNTNGSSQFSLKNQNHVYLA